MYLYSISLQCTTDYYCNRPATAYSCCCCYCYSRHSRHSRHSRPSGPSGPSSAFSPFWSVSSLWSHLSPCLSVGFCMLVAASSRQLQSDGWLSLAVYDACRSLCWCLCSCPLPLLPLGPFVRLGHYFTVTSSPRGCLLLVCFFPIRTCSPYTHILLE